MIEIDVRIENIYEDPLDESLDAMKAVFDDTDASNVEVQATSNIAAVTLTLDVGDMPTELASADEWEEWGQEVILPFTGIGRQEGCAGYFAEIVDCKHTEYQHVIGQSWEWCG